MTRRPGSAAQDRVGGRQHRSSIPRPEGRGVHEQQMQLMQRHPSLPSRRQRPLRQRRTRESVIEKQGKKKVGLKNLTKNNKRKPKKKVRYEIF